MFSTVKKFSATESDVLFQKLRPQKKVSYFHGVEIKIVNNREEKYM